MEPAWASQSFEELGVSRAYLGPAPQISQHNPAPVPKDPQDSSQTTRRAGTAWVNFFFLTASQGAGLDVPSPW